MKWVNKQEQLKAIAKAVGCTLATILFVVLWIIPGLRLQSKGITPPRPHVKDKGLELMARYTAPVDSTLISIGAQYLSYCIAADSLKPGEKLYRISVCKTLPPSDDLISVLHKNGCRFYWKETGQNQDYRIIYCNINKERLTEIRLKEMLKREYERKADISLVIERVVVDVTDYLAFDSLI